MGKSEIQPTQRIKNNIKFLICTLAPSRYDQRRKEPLTADPGNGLMFRHASALLYRRLRISRRTLLISLCLLGIVAGIYVHRSLRQRRGVAAIRQFGGDTAYDYQLTSDFVFRNAPSWVPARVRRSLGDDYFHSIIYVHMTYGRDRLSSLPGDAVDEEYLSQIAGFSRLKHLTLSSPASLTEAGARHVSCLHCLETLCLRHTDMTDESVRLLGELPRLEHLDLRGTRITDQALAHAGRMKTLRVLWVGGDSVNPSITDDGLLHLAKLPRLHALDLRGTAVTDQGLARLKGLKLRWLNVQQTGVRDISSIKNAFPNCEIEY